MKEVIVHGVLAVLGLGLAYQTWTREPDAEETPESVTVTECRESDLSRLAFSDETHDVKIEPQRRGSELDFWVTVDRKVPRPRAAADGGVEEPAQAEEPKTRRFLANAAFKTYLEQYAPLRASQGLGTLSSERLAAFGFDRVDATLSLQCGSKALELEAGALTYGAGQRYMRDKKSQQVYLFKDDLITAIAGAEFRFMQTDLHDFQPVDVEEATVDMRGTKKRLLHRDRKLPAQETWVDAAAPGKRNELYGNWINRLFQLRAREYLPTGAEPGSDLTPRAGERTPVLRVDYKLEGKPEQKLEVVTVEDAAGVPHYYARSEATRGWVALTDSQAQETEHDAALVVGIEPPPSTTRPASSGAQRDPHGGKPGLQLAPGATPHAPAAQDPHGP